MGRDARIRDVIDGPLLDVPWEATRIGELSGGQRRRVALAKLLFRG
jgi:ATPase subunit of ABC transporter with duplicated ATPase domains